MELMICGVRGSTPASGPEFVRYGGHTSCIAVSRAGEPPAFVIDGGTGLQRLSPAYDGGAFHGTIVLGHLHWDHTHGLPFFAAGNLEDAEVRLLVPAQGEPERDVLARAISPPHFPVEAHELRGRWTVDGIEPGEHTIEGFSVLMLEIPHKGGRTYGFRVSDDRATFAYLSDHSPIAFGGGPDGYGEYHENAKLLAGGADLLIHDAQHVGSEFEECAYLGHSTVEYAAGLAEACNAGRLLLYHHAPDRTDEEIDKILERLRRDATIPVDAAAEGMRIALP